MEPFWRAKPTICCKTHGIENIWRYLNIQIYLWILIMNDILFPICGKRCHLYYLYLYYWKKVSWILFVFLIIDIGFKNNICIHTRHPKILFPSLRNMGSYTKEIQSKCVRGEILGKPFCRSVSAEKLGHFEFVVGIL